MESDNKNILYLGRKLILTHTLLHTCVIVCVFVLHPKKVVSVRRTWK
jgi:hypothetical protein